MYTKTDVEKLLVQYFNDAWDMDDELGPEPGMPKAKNNPARQGGILAEKIDLEYAFHALSIDAESLRLRYGNGETIVGVSEQVGTSAETISRHIDFYISEILEEMNTSAVRKGI